MNREERKGHAKKMWSESHDKWLLSLGRPSAEITRNMSYWHGYFDFYLDLDQTDISPSPEDYAMGRTDAKGDLDEL